MFNCSDDFRQPLGGGVMFAKFARESVPKMRSDLVWTNS
jgi:hypothetical protein